MWTVDGWTIRDLDGGGLRLDGGAMFGNVPRILWERLAAADEEHRIALAARVLYAEGHGRRVLVDTGTGHLWNAKEERMFAVRATEEPKVLTSLREIGVLPETITDVVLTHLHFDHAGGVSRRGDDGEPVPSFPGAIHYVQKANMETAASPNARERASYLERHLAPLSRVERRLTEGSEEILPGVFVARSDGHTRGLQTVRFGAGAGAISFPADLSPFAAHFQIPWTMGYDMCAETVMREKTLWLEEAEGEGYTVVLEHDPVHAAVRIGRDERGRPIGIPLPPGAT